MWFLALFSVVFSCFLMGLSAFPGVLEQAPRQLMLALGIAFAVFALACVARRLLGPAGLDGSRRRASAIVVLLTLVVVPIALAEHLPRRLLFHHCQGEFEALLPGAPPAGDRSIVPLNADLKLLWIDQWGTDRRGGTYFRTLDGFQRSFGFVYRPNREGSPFGDADYELQHLTGDWYSFAASDKR